MKANIESTRIGKRGTVVIPARVREHFGLFEGAFLIVEESRDGILLRPASVAPLKIYSAEEKAEFLLSNVIDEEDYKSAREAVKQLGLNPDKIKHRKI